MDALLLTMLANCSCHVTIVRVVSTTVKTNNVMSSPTQVLQLTLVKLLSWRHT